MQKIYFTKQAKYYCINITQILLSEFGFILLLGIILFLVYIILQSQSKKNFTSKQKLDYNNGPIIFIHTTDFHMSINKKDRTDGSSIFMMSLIEYIPDLFLQTGDYVVNVKQGQEVGYQNLEEWKMYNITIIGLLIKKGFNVIEVSGNHDQWGVDH